MQHLRLFFRKDRQAKHFFLRSTLLWMAFLAATTTYAQQPFITTWKTDNPGSSNSTSITIPTTSSGYNYEVDWDNDGTYDQSGITGDVTHDFGVAGTYTIRLRGAFPRIYFNFSGDSRKLLDVGQWGDVAWTSMGSAFRGCLNLNITATDLPNLSGVTSMAFMFQFCNSLNGPANIGNWNTANVTNMTFLFASADAFNQPIDNWNTTNVTDMSFMFYETAAFNQPLDNWNTANVTDMSSMFRNAQAFNQPIGNWALNASVNMGIMLSNSGLDCDNYSATLIGWSNNPATPNGRSLDADDLQYGTNAVAARTNLTTTKGWTVALDVASGTDCTLVMSFITTWKTDNPGTSNSTSIMIPTTGGGYNYEVDWNNDGTYDQSGITGSVTHDFGVAGTYTIRLRGAFPRIYFNNGGDRRKLLDVGQWGDITWTSMNNAFSGCNNLNVSATDLPNLSGVTDLSRMFQECSILNGPANIGNWNTANVTNMSLMFFKAFAFNQSIGAWSTAAVTDMSALFSGASAFNQPIGNWNTANVTNMSSMFQNTPFNQPIGTWNTTNVSLMLGMFNGATAFNQAIDNWNTANVTNMSGMFQGAPAFNQPIGTWNTAAVTNMSSMFQNATAFNQSLGTWTLRPAGVNLSNMLNGSGLDCTNYSLTLIGWNSNAGTPNGVVLGATGRQYDASAVAARNNLIMNKAWTISGDAACFILPVTLIGFTGKQQANGVLLEWQTAGEQNNKGFFIERSVDGLRWTDIGFVAGKGTSTEVQDYAFLDKKPLPIVNYYRLRQIDFDGNEELSKVVSVHLQNAGTVRIYPNPVANGELQLFLPENTAEETMVHLFNLAGQLVRSVTLGQGTNLLNISELPTGIYTLQIMNDTVNSFEQIVVAH